MSTTYESERTQSTDCAECGAASDAGLSCSERLGILIAWEQQDPDLLDVHFLTVASYNLQHPAQFTDAAIAGLRQAFIDRLDRGISIEAIRRRASAATEGSTRVLRRESERRPVRRAWTVTIADVCIAEQPAGAADRVRRWAAAIRAEL